MNLAVSFMARNWVNKMSMSRQRQLNYILNNSPDPTQRRPYDDSTKGGFSRLSASRAAHSHVVYGVVNVLNRLTSPFQRAYMLPA